MGRSLAEIFRFRSLPAKDVKDVNVDHTVFGRSTTLEAVHNTNRPGDVHLRRVKIVQDKNTVSSVTRGK